MSLKEAASRIYREVVRRRAIVRITYPSMEELTEPPIFVLGHYRSGSTLLRYCLDSHSRIAVPPESEFLYYLYPMMHEAASLEGLDSLGFDGEHVRRRLREFTSYFFNSYAKSQGKPRWGDKSPRYSHCPEFLRLLFPEAKFVMIFRHPLDQIHSFTRGGSFIHEQLAPLMVEGEDARIAAARYWRDRAEDLLEFDSDANVDSLIVRYEDLCTFPARTLGAVVDHLGEEWEEGVLNYHLQRHDLGREAGRVNATEGFNLSTGKYEQWPSEVISDCAAMVAPLMQKLGYADERGRS